jgi:DNA (cytosine-5)-methyltransferase 1
MGGGALAAARSGYGVVCFDFDKDAVTTLSANGFEAHRARVEDVNWTPYNGADLLIGGPPCQSFSQGGLQSGESDPRNSIPAFVSAVKAVRPRVFIMENVRGLTFKKNRPYLDSVLDELRSFGYLVDWRVLNAADYGVPQTRQRVFIVGRLDNEEPVWPAPSHGKYPGGKPWVSFADALGWAPDGSEFTTRPATTVVGSFGADVIAGPGYRTAGGPSRQNAPGSAKVTHEERLILQGFPKNWALRGFKTSIDRQLGNACPPPLLQAVITAQTTFVEVPATAYKQALDVALRTERVRTALGDFDEVVDPLCFLSPDGWTGFVVDQDSGTLNLLFNVGPRGRGSAAVQRAVLEGARQLDCFDGGLVRFYERHGWKIVNREANWTPGEPDVVFMEVAG